MKGNIERGFIRIFCTLLVFMFIFSNISPFITIGEGATNIGLDMVALVGNFFESHDMGSNWDPQNRNGVMNQYNSNIYEISILLNPGVYEYKVALNGGWDENYSNANSNVNIGDGGNAQLVLDSEKLVHFRFDNNAKKLYDSENNPTQFKQSATLVGNLSELAETGKWWDPYDSNFDLEYIGGGFYRGAFELDVGQLEYKIVFNHAWDNGELGDNGGNIKVDIESKGIILFLVDTIQGIVYDSIRNPEITNTVSLIGPIRTAIDSNIGSNNEWEAELEGFEFYPISDYEYAYTALLPKGTYEYKGIENYSWDEGGFPPADENYEITISSDLEYVVFIADLREKAIINSVEDLSGVENRLGIGDIPSEEEERVVRFRYIRPDGDYDGWNIWVWHTGAKDGQIDFEEIEDGVAIANIKISPETERIGFVLRKGTDWEEKDAYSADRYIEIDKNERITKVTVTSGIGEFEQPPSITGPEFRDGKIVFYYRDSDLYSEDLMHTIEDVKLRIADPDDEDNYKLYDMTYSDADEYFYYEFEPKPSIERYEYNFIVTYQDGSSVEIKDPYNPDSYVEYKVKEFGINWDIQPREIDYNQNAVIAIEISDDTVEPREVYLDLTELGGPKEYYVDTELMKATIAVKDTIVAGDKEIPITVVDKYGNIHVENAEISIKTRLIENGDFDWDEAVIYFLLTDRFMNGDPTNDDPNGEQYDKSHPETYHGGDLKGITKKLDYLKDLGVNTIWITPIVDNIDFNKGADFSDVPENRRYQYGYHGYWAQDFTKLDEHLGTLEDLHELIDEAHDRGMKIMVDVVINHAGYGLKPGDEEMWGHLRNFPSEEVRNKFYIDIDGQGSSMFRDGGNDEIKGELAGLPDFMTEIPEVREQIIKWQTDWLDMAKTRKGNTIDYFRVDTVKHVEDTTWKAFKNRLTEKAPNFKLIGEYFGASVDNAFDSELDKGQMDSLLDFDFKYKAKDFADGKIDEVEEYLEYRNAKLSNTATLGQFLSSHDEDGFLYRVGGDIGKLKVASALQITAKGQPVIYYGEELGLTGKNAGDMSKGEFSENRYDMDWDRLENDEYRHIYEHYRTLLNIRREYSKLFAKGDRQKVVGSDAEKYVVFKRTYNDQSAYVGINVEDEDKEIFIKTDYPSETVVEDLYSSKKYIVKDDGELVIDLPASSSGGTVILVASEAEEPTPKPVEPEDPVEDDDPSDEEEPTIPKEKEWVVVDDIIIDGTGHIQGLSIKSDCPGVYKDNVFELGTVGESRRLEGFTLELKGKGMPSDMMLVYRAHIQTYGDCPDGERFKAGIWKDSKGNLWQEEGVYLGTKGERRRIEGIELKLLDKKTEKEYEGYKVQYQVHMQGYGWGIDDLENDLRDDGKLNDSFGEWAEDGDFAGTRGQSRRVEAVRIRILREQ